MRNPETYKECRRSALRPAVMALAAVMCAGAAAGASGVAATGIAATVGDAAGTVLEAFAPLRVYAAEPGALHSAEEMEHLSDNVLEWYEIDGLISEYNAAVVKNRNEFNNDKRRTYDAAEVRNYLMDQADEMDSLADSYEDTAAVLSATYRGQANSLRLQAESNVTDHEIILLQYELIEKQTDAAARQAFLNYYNATYEREYAESNLAYLERAYASAVNRQRVGMATEIEVLTAKESLDTARAGLLTAETSVGSLRNNLLVMCGWKYDSDGVIGALPEPDAATAAETDYESDRTAARAANLTLRMDEIKLRNARSGGHSGLVIEQNENQLTDDEASFGIRFRAAYDALVNAVTAWRNAGNDKAVADQNLATAERQLTLGTISAVELEGTRNAQKAAELALRKAYIAVISARAAYDDAVAGNI